jgi:hypothetical protein
MMSEKVIETKIKFGPIYFFPVLQQTLKIIIISKMHKTIDGKQLEALIQPFDRVLVMTPRRSHKTHFLSDFVERHGDDRSIYICLTKKQCDEFSVSCERKVQCLHDIAQLPPGDESIVPPLLVLDEATFMNFEKLRPYFNNYRVVAISSPCADAVSVDSFVQTGFTVIDAPLCM